jgi:hypothetical protein
MNMRQGIVVDVHPEDHSVDLVMMDDGSRMIGVQVLTSNGSARSGSVNMPSVPARKDKWDITKRNGQDQIAIVGFIRNNPVVVGYLFPQISQMTFKEQDRAFTRHTSDVYSTVDANGNMELHHPSGAFVRFAESLEHEDLGGKNVDKNLALDRNTERNIGVRVFVPGAFDLSLTPDGALSVTVAKGGALEFAEALTIKAPSVTLDTPSTHITGPVVVDGDVTIDGISFLEHVHSGILRGPDNTDPPVG